MLFQQRVVGITQCGFVETTMFGFSSGPCSVFGLLFMQLEVGFSVGCDVFYLRLLVCSTELDPMVGGWVVASPLFFFVTPRRLLFKWYSSCDHCRCYVLWLPVGLPRFRADRHAGPATHVFSRAGHRPGEDAFGYAS